MGKRTFEEVERIWESQNLDPPDDEGELEESDFDPEPDDDFELDEALAWGGVDR